MGLLMRYLKSLWPLLGTYISLLAVILTLPEGMKLGVWRLLFLLIGTVLFLYLCYDDIKSNKMLRFKKKRDWQGKVRKYMDKWIRNGNKVAIYSHDLSWVDDDIKSLLCQKATKKELVICLPKYTDLTKQLDDMGAEILVYGDNGYMPDSRFTIVNYGTGTPSVAMAHFDREEHVIEECSAGEHPAVFVANDLVAIIKKYSEMKKAVD